MSLTNEKIIKMYTKMVTARLLEEMLQEMFSEGMLHGTTHLGIGQEASGIAACMTLSEGDKITLTHRNHVGCVGIGMDVRSILAEMFGKETGACGGFGGSMHLVDYEKGNMGANGIVGGGLGLAVGAALKMKYKDENNIVICFMGDGATNEGLFHEALNLATIWKLPIIFYVENNGYAVSMPTQRSMNIKDIEKRAESYGMRSIILDGNNAIDVYNMTFSAVQYVREGNGPMLIESKTYRISGHSKSDTEQLYRSQEEIKSWLAKCPIKRLEEYMLKNNVARSEMLKEINTQVMEELKQAVLFSQNSLEPSVEDIRKYVYAK
jgi:pyruvate dehydrogenase E1 component alpha subunit